MTAEELKDQGLFSCEDIGISFDGRPVLKNVSLGVNRGEVHGFVGPNGAGKTSLFEVLTGRYTPSGGRIYLEGRDISKHSVHDRAQAGLARTYQSPVVPSSMRVAEVFRAARYAYKPWLTRHDAERGARQAEFFVPWDTPAGALGTFDRRKLLLACLLMRKPRVMLLDEPAAGLINAEIDEL